jgi:hypothetical protein
MMMKKEDAESYIESQYSQLKDYQYKRNSQILFNLIKAKSILEASDYKRSLYVDVKKFVESYIKSVDAEDYGYDSVNLSKIEEAANVLDYWPKLSVLLMTRRMLLVRGYDVEELHAIIDELDCKIAKSERRYLRFIMLWMSHKWWTLLISYVLYIAVIFVVLLPAPIKEMVMFQVEKKDFCNSSLLNHLGNVMALLTGNDTISPIVQPVGLGGVLVYCVGFVMSYFIIGNFVFRKLTDYFTFR